MTGSNLYVVIFCFVLWISLCDNIRYRETMKLWNYSFILSHQLKIGQASQQQRIFYHNSDKPKRRSHGLREPMIRGRIGYLSGPLKTLPKRLDVSSVYHKLLCNYAQGYHFQSNLHCIETTNLTERIYDSYMIHRGVVMDWYFWTALEYLENDGRTSIIKKSIFQWHRLKWCYEAWGLLCFCIYRERWNILFHTGIVIFLYFLFTFQSFSINQWHYSKHWWSVAYIVRACCEYSISRGNI